MEKEALIQPTTIEAQTTNKLLNPEERQACQRISTGETAWSQRAQALLAIDEGATQAEAGQPAGLTSGQVKYWLGKFRQSRLDIFPENVLEIAVIESVLPEPVTAESSQEAKKPKETEKPDEGTGKQSKKEPTKKSKVDKDTPKKKKKAKNKKSKGQGKKKGKKKKKPKGSKKDKSTKAQSGKKSKKINKS